MTFAKALPSLQFPPAIRSRVRITRSTTAPSRALLPAQSSPYGEEPWPLT